MSHVPLHVYALFYGLMYWGYKCCFERTMRVERLMLLPMFFVFFSLRSVVNLFHMGPIGLAIWSAGMLSGVLPGYLHVRNNVIRADHAQKLISVPGDWTMLVLIIFIFGFEFFVNYCMHAGWGLSRVYAFHVAAQATLGFIAGMAMGRSVTTSYKYSVAPSENLLVTAYEGKA